MSVYPLTLGDIYVGIPFTRGRHICRLTFKRVNHHGQSFWQSVYRLFITSDLPDASNLMERTCPAISVLEC